MNAHSFLRFILPISALICTGQLSAADANSGFPFADEDLAYTINWQSGLSLGEAHLHAKHSGANWNFQFDVDASVPGFQVKDSYHSEATPAFCSVLLERNASHGARKTDEKETIDGSVVSRSTSKGGGASSIPVPDCTKDALTFLYFARRELGQGRVPPSQQILMGGLYQARLDYAGAQTIAINEVPTPSDKIVCTIKGLTSEFKFEMYFARDPARTPLLIKAPFPLGVFSMELVR